MGFFKKQLNLAHGAPKNQAPDDRYGPKRGIKAITLDELIALYRVPFEAICQTVGLPHDMEAKILRPILRRYAAHVHLLPGSQSNHHIEPGGLLFHGFETAQIAVQSAEGVYFIVDGQPPSERKRMEPRWRVALVVASIAHDLGKPITDMIIVADGVETAWNPLEMSLCDWLVKHSILYYHYMWKERRHAQHKTAGLLLLNTLMGDSIGWLNEYGGHCIPAILAYLSGGESQISGLVANADEISANRGNQEPHTDAIRDGGYIPIKAKLVAAMKSAIESRMWAVNSSHAQVYVSAERAWLMWPTCADAIIHYLFRANTPGLSKDPARIAQLLVETNIATPVNKNGSVANPYWTIRPAGVEIGKDGLLAICVPTSTLFDVSPPNFTVHVDGESVESKITATKLAGDATHPVAPPTVQTVADVPTQEVLQKTVTLVPPAKRQEEDADPGALTPEGARIWLEKAGGSTGTHIGMLARQINSNLTRWGAQMIYRGENVWVVVPDGLPANVEVRDFQRELDRLTWIEYDVNNPMRHVRTIGNGRRGIPLKKNVSGKIVIASGGKPTSNDSVEQDGKEKGPTEVDLPVLTPAQPAPSTTHNVMPLTPNIETGAATPLHPVPDHAQAMLRMIIKKKVPEMYQPDIGAGIVKIPSDVIPWYLGKYTTKGVGTLKLTKLLSTMGCKVAPPYIILSIEIWNQLKQETST